MNRVSVSTEQKTKIEIEQENLKTWKSLLKMRAPKRISMRFSQQLKTIERKKKMKLDRVRERERGWEVKLKKNGGKKSKILL